MNTSFGFSKEIDIDGRKIGSNHPVFVIAEIGINHNADKNIAKKLIDKIAESGADSVKFQTFSTEEFMSDLRMEYEYESAGQIVRENMYDMFKRLELPLQWHKELFSYARKKGLIPLSTPADIKSADFLADLGISAFKLGSDDLINLPLIRHLVIKGKPIIFSTGMAEEIEISDAVEICKNENARHIVILHCVSLYPAPDGDINLKRMKTLFKHTGSIVGYSDHSEGVEAALGAVSLGAKVIEKHITLDKCMEGPDHKFSSNPEELKQLVRSIRRMEKMLGNGELKPSDSEMVVRKEFRRSIVAACDLAKGCILKSEHLALKRPGKGFKPKEIDIVIGKKLIKDIAMNEMIAPQHFK